MESIFVELTVIICLAAFFAVVFRFFGQPTILAYILTGIIVGPFGQLQLQNPDVLRTMGEFGITLLLFLVGLELKLSDLKAVGKFAAFSGLMQIILTAVFGYAVATFFGFSVLTSIYIGAALSFSSTVIAVNLLSDTKELKSLHGRLSVGILLVQDFFAIFLLVLLSAVSRVSADQLSFLTFFVVVLKGVVLFVSVIYLSKAVFPFLTDKIAKSQDTLFLVSVAWVLGLAVLVTSPLIGFSIEIGGFLAGIALANATENFQIVARAKVLRDFFITLFFVTLGMQMQFGNLSQLIFPTIVLTVFVLLGKPLILTAILGFMGYRRRTAILTGINLGQISEFSLIVVFVGFQLGHLSKDIVSMITTVGIATFVSSAYLISNSKKLSRFLHPHFGIFERGNTHRELLLPSDKLTLIEDHVILVGFHRMGESIFEALIEAGETVLIVDFDPDVVRALEEKGSLAVFGDIADPDIQERIKLDKAKLVISTVTDVEDNLVLIDGLTKSNRKAKIIAVALDKKDEKTLYKAGADYIVIPHLVGGLHLAKIIKAKHLKNMDPSFFKKMLQ